MIVTVEIVSNYNTPFELWLEYDWGLGAMDDGSWGCWPGNMTPSNGAFHVDGGTLYLSDRSRRVWDYVKGIARFLPVLPDIEVVGTLDDFGRWFALHIGDTGQGRFRVPGWGPRDVTWRITKGAPQPPPKSILTDLIQVLEPVAKLPVLKL